MFHHSLLKPFNFYQSYILLATPDGVGGGIFDDKDTDTDETLDEEELEEDADEDKNGDEEEEEDEEELEGKGKEDKEEEVTLTRVEFKDIKGKYPNFFKDFPDLKHAFFREQQFTELFPTVEEAKAAMEARDAYEEITAAVVDGDAKKFLSELGTESKEGLESFARNFIPALQESNRDLFLDILSPQVSQFVRNVYHHGVKEKDENIKNAAKLVHKTLFGGSYDDVEKDAPLMTPKGEVKDDKTEKDKQEYYAKKYNDLYQDVTTSCYSKLDEEIDRGLSDLTKTKPGLKKILARDIKNRVLDEMNKDEAYLGRMNNLWKREQRNGFSGTNKSSFVTNFLAKSKAIIPKIRVEVRKEALGKDDVREERDTTVNRHSGGRATSGGNSKKMTPERARTEKLTTRAVFDD